MQFVEFLIWLFFEVICASTGLVLAKTAMLVL